jgi:hypothetical protein
MYIDPASYEKAYQQSDPPAWVTKEPVDLLTRLALKQPKPAKSSAKKKRNWKSRWTRKRKKKRTKK